MSPPPPGSRAGLLPPSPLRTAHESFPSSSSSLSNAPCGTRWCHIQRLAMDLPVAVGVQEDTVLCRVHPDLWYTVPPMKGGIRYGPYTVHRRAVPPHGVLGFHELN